MEVISNLTLRLGQFPPVLDPGNPQLIQTQVLFSHPQQSGFILRWLPSKLVLWFECLFSPFHFIC